MDTTTRPRLRWQIAHPEHALIADHFGDLVYVAVRGPHGRWARSILTTDMIEPTTPSLDPYGWAVIHRMADQTAGRQIALLAPGITYETVGKR